MRRLPALFIPSGLSAQLTKALTAFKERLDALFDPKDPARAVTVADLQDPEFLKNETSILDSTASPDNIPPGLPAGIATTKHESFIRVSWENPADKDLERIDVYRKESAGGAATRIAIVTAPTAHYDDLDVDPLKSYWYYLICVDDSGNAAEMAPLVDGDNVVLASEVPAPDAITSPGWTQDDLHVVWDPVDGFGVSGYRVMVVSGGVEVRSETVSSPEFVYSFAKNAEDGLRSSLSIRVWTLDKNGSPSPSYAAAAFTHAMPAIPGSVTVTTRDLGFMVEWSAPQDKSVTGYDVGLNGLTLETVTDIRYLHKSLLKAGSYQFQVRSRNRFGQVSGWNTQTYVVYGPNSPDNFKAQVISNTVILYWMEPIITELPIAEYEIRKGDWNYPTEIYRTKTDFTTITEAQAGVFTYHVAAVDTAGNIGAYASLTARADDPPGYELNVEWRDDFLGGSSSNVQVLPDGSAYAPCYVDQTIRQKFVGSGSDVAPQFASVRAMVDAGFTYPIGPVPATAEFSEEHDYGAKLTSSTITSTLSKEDFLGGPEVSTFLAAKELPGDAYLEEENTRVTRHNFQFVRDRFVFSSDGKQFGKLQLHTLRLDSKPVSESWKGEISDANAGLYHAFDKPFADIKNIHVTIYDDGSRQLGFAVDFNDVPYPTGCTIYLIDSNGKTTGVVGGKAEGYV